MPAVIFDLDGTLVDSAADIHAAVAQLLAEHTVTTLSPPAVRAMVGHGVPTLIDRVIAATGTDPGVRAAWIARFLVIYEQDAAGLTTPYAGVEDALNTLSASGMTLGLCTNKPGGPTRALLRALGWQDRFASIICGDSLPTRKPDPAMLHTAVRETGRPVLYVGDSEVDAETAHAAGIGFLLYTQGYRKTPAADLDPLASFDHFADLPALVARHLG